MKITKKKIRLDEPIKIKDDKYIIREQFVALSVRWVRCETKRGENKYFTEAEVLRWLS